MIGAPGLFYGFGAAVRVGMGVLVDTREVGVIVGSLGGLLLLGVAVLVGKVI